MRLELFILVVIALSAAGCGPRPEAEEPIDVGTAPEPSELPPPPPPPQIRCRADGVVASPIKADAVFLAPSDGDPTVVLSGPRAIRLATVNEDGSLAETKTLVKLRRSTAQATDSGPEHLVVVEAASIKRGKSNLKVSRFTRSGDRVGKALTIRRAGIVNADIDVVCSAEACMLAWTEEGEEEGDTRSVGRVVTFTEEGLSLVGEEHLVLPGSHSFLWRQGDALEVIIGQGRHVVDLAGSVATKATVIELPRGGMLKLSDSPTGGMASMFVESTMPYGMLVAVRSSGGGEPRKTRLWDQASQERRFGLTSGPLGFGAAWARPEESGPYGEPASGESAAKVFFQGFSTSGVPHGEAVAVIAEVESITSMSLSRRSAGYLLAWASPSRRRGQSKVSIAALTCRELTAEEAAAEEAAAEQSAEESAAGEAVATDAAQGDAGTESGDGGA